MSDNFDWESISQEDVKSSDGPLSGSRTKTGTTRRRRKTSQTRLDQLQVTLSKQMFMAGTMVGLGLPVTGYYACQESDAFTKAVVQLASHRPEWIEALEHLADLQPGLMIGRTAIGLGSAMAIDRAHRREDYEQEHNLAGKQVMKFLGVHAAWLAVNNPDIEMEEGSAYRPPPATFASVA